MMNGQCRAYLCRRRPAWHDGRIVKQGARRPSRFENVRGTATTKLTTNGPMAMLRGSDD